MGPGFEEQLTRADNRDDSLGSVTAITETINTPSSDLGDDHLPANGDRSRGGGGTSEVPFLDAGTSSNNHSIHFNR